MPDTAVYDHMRHTAGAISDPLRAAIERIGPIVVGPPIYASVADRLFVEIINQQLSTKAALAIWGRIEATAAARMLTARDLFVAGHEEALRSCGVSGNKVKALHAVREAEQAGRLGPDLALMPHEARSVILCRIRGVDQWTADIVGIFHYLDPDIWPVGVTWRRSGACDSSVGTTTRRWSRRRSLRIARSWLAILAGAGQRGRGTEGGDR